VFDAEDTSEIFFSCLSKLLDQHFSFVKSGKKLGP